MGLKSKWIGAVSGAVLASAVAMGAQADETPLANETPVTVPEATLHEGPPTPTSCKLDLENPRIKQESYYYDTTGNGTKVFKAFGYVAPEEGQEDEPRQYTGCTYTYLNADRQRVIGHRDLSEPGTLSNYMGEIARAAEREQRQLATDERKAIAEAEKGLSPTEKRCNRMQRDIDELSKDGITDREQRQIMQKVIGMQNLGCGG